GRVPPAAMSVSELSARVKDRIEPAFADVWVAGEVSNVVRASSGHVYLSLKDDEAVLRAVVWRGTVSTLAIEPADGLAVVCHGRLEVYPPRGSYQLTIDRLHAVGTGGLEARLRQLHARLAAEGLFAAERKRPLPAVPQRIVVVTSPAGAAIADFLQTLANRWPACAVVVVPARVQGAGAAEEVATAIARAAHLTPPVEVIAVIRGGGSLEDLWAFNEEPLVRAVAASPVPVVSGVGHETDVSLCDLVADVRALTPTDAAVRISPDRQALLAQVALVQPRLSMLMTRQLVTARERLERLAASRALTMPERLVAGRRDLVCERAARLDRLIRTLVRHAGDRLAAVAGRVEAASPLQILSRGYSVTIRDAGSADGMAVRDAAEVKPGQRLLTRLARGRVWSIVERSVADPEPRVDDPPAGAAAPRPVTSGQRPSGDPSR
ncbi:MAG: exodeoxyribonuclease VII large subunit, partial [Pirellulales bacterium]